MTLQEMHDQTAQLLANGVPGDTKLVTTSDFSIYLEAFEPSDLATVTTLEGTTFVLMDLGDPRANEGCFAVTTEAGWTEDQSKF